MLSLFIPRKAVLYLIFLSWFLIHCVDEIHLYTSFEFCYCVYGMVWD